MAKSLTRYLSTLSRVGSVPPRLHAIARGEVSKRVRSSAFAGPRFGIQLQTAEKIFVRSVVTTRHNIGKCGSDSNFIEYRGPEDFNLRSTTKAEISLDKLCLRFRLPGDRVNIQCHDGVASSLRL